MDTLEAIRDRKSIRSYTGEPPTQTQMAAILAAANQAPCGRGAYTTLHLTVIQDKSLLADIDSNAAAFAGDPSRHPLYGAPVLVVVSSSGEGNVPSANVAMVVHNMALAAVALGVGHCDIYGALRALSSRPDIIERFGLPEGFSPLGAIALGLSERTYTPRKSKARIATNLI